MHYQAVVACGSHSVLLNALMNNGVGFDPIFIKVSVVKGFLYHSSTKYVIKGQKIDWSKPSLHFLYS